jgi:flagellar biosynthesis regulator FlaF
MIFDELGLPKDTGASDLQDSSRLAGIMTIFSWPQRVPCEKYFDGSKYVRHPKEYVYDFSRDQALCLMAGLAWQGHHGLVSKKYINGRDLFTPAHMGHIARCQGKRASVIQDLWLWTDVMWSCFVKPMSEPNQLLAMMMMASPIYLNFWVEHNKKWQESIREYWSGWRGESDLAEHIISQIKKILQK